MALGGITMPVMLNLLLKLILFSVPGGELTGYDISLQQLLQELSGLPSLVLSFMYIVAQGVIINKSARIL